MADKRLHAWMPALVGLALALGARADSNVRIVSLSLMTGAVQINLPDGHGWRPALLNAPLIGGEQVRTLASGRAEILFEDGSTLRLIPNSEISLPVLSLSDAGVFSTTAKLVSGTVFVTLRKADSKNFDLLLPSGDRVAPEGAACFRVDATPAAVTVFDGKASVQAGDRRLAVNKDETATLAAQQSPAVSQASARPDPWTQWSRTRDQYYQNALHNGVQPGSFVSYANWYGSAPGLPGPSYYTGTGLTYLGATTCPWTVASGDYAGWCWTEPNGWFRPAQAPAMTPTLAGTSDVAQTNAVLASARRAGNANYAGSFYGGPCSALPINPFSPNSIYSLGFYGNSASGGMSCADVYDDLWFESNGLDVVPVTLPPTVGASASANSPRLGIPSRHSPGQHFDPVVRGISAGHSASGRLGPPPPVHRIGSTQASGLQASRTSFVRVGGGMMVRGGGGFAASSAGSRAFSPSLAAASGSARAAGSAPSRSGGSAPSASMGGAGAGGGSGSTGGGRVVH